VDSGHAAALPHGQHVVAVAALVIQGERVLAMRRAPSNLAGPGLWETISGRIEHGEEPLAAVIREIAEESGLTVEVEPRPFAAYTGLRRGLPMIVIAFRARYLAGEVQRSEEHDACAWCTVEEFRARSTLAPLVAVVERALREPWPTNG
jgi:8-oxo-dGTP diphosphatase